MTQSTLFFPANIYDVNGISFHGDQTYQWKQKQKRLKTDQVKIEEILKEVTTARQQTDYLKVPQIDIGKNSTKQYLLK